ncbi:MAG: response regulator transcription factor [Actinomycetota bacterium]|nr:response regulator transcription factor [Actinomycetota bacterium]
MPRDRILVVEDDPAIATNLRRALVHAGYDVETAATGAAAIATAVASPPALVLLDLGLADLDGLEVCRELRRLDIGTPIIMLTARDEEIDVVVGLDVGAVDYVTKPFRLSELLARIRVQLRPPTEHRGTVTVGDVELDLDARRARSNGVELRLTAKEWELLAALVTRAGTVVTREQLMADVWDANWFGSTKTLDVHITSLRRKLGEDAGAPSRITALRGVGYRFDVPAGER